MQNVAYDHVNGSHFRGTDIWLSGMDPSTLGPQPDSGATSTIAFRAIPTRIPTPICPTRRAWSLVATSSRWASIGRVASPWD